MLPIKMVYKIHWLKRQAGLSDELYRTALSSYGVESSKDLSYGQAVDLIRKLNNLLPKEIKENISRKQGTRRKYDELGIRWNEQTKEYYATPKQLRMIEGMWMTHPLVEQKNEEALNRFIFKITGVQRIEWLTMGDVRKVVNAIKNLKKGKKNE